MDGRRARERERATGTSLRFTTADADADAAASLLHFFPFARRRRRRGRGGGWRVRLRRAALRASFIPTRVSLPPSLHHIVCLFVSLFTFGRLPSFSRPLSAQTDRQTDAPIAKRSVCCFRSATPNNHQQNDDANACVRAGKITPKEVARLRHLNSRGFGCVRIILASKAE